jgi:hypothetical protein
MISDPMVRLAQAVHLTCSHTNTVTERTETRLHMCHITLEFHRRHPKRFLSLWYVRRKPCTNLALILTPSTNRPKRDLTWPTSPRSSIGCAQNDFWAYGTFSVNNAPILSQDYHYFQTEWNELPLEPRHLGEQSGASKMISTPMVRSRKPCTYLPSWLTLSPNGPKWASTWA